MNENYLVIEKPGFAYSKDKKVPWIIFYFDKESPKNSSWETIQIPMPYCKGCAANLLSLSCHFNQFRLAIGTEKHSEDFIYLISQNKAKLTANQKMKVFFRGQYKSLTMSDPVVKKLKNKTSYILTFSEKIRKTSTSTVQTLRRLVVEARVGQKNVKKWLLWKDSFNESVDRY